MIIEIPHRFPGAELRRQQTSDNILGAGLARAPRNGDNRHSGHPVPHRASQFAQRERRIRNHQLQSGRRAFYPALHHRRGSSLRQHLRHIIVTVVRGPAQRKKTVARIDAARIDAPPRHTVRQSRR